MKSVLILITTTILIFSCNEGTKQQSNSPQDTIGAETDDIVAEKRDTVNNPQLVKAGIGDSIFLTAENGKPVGPKIKYMPEWSAFGWFTAADWVEWDIEVNKPGEYEAYLEWSVSDEDAGKEFIMETKDGQLTGVVKPSGSWETFKNENIGKINLSAGRQKIIFRSKTKFEKGALLDLRQIKLVAGK